MTRNKERQTEKAVRNGRCENSLQHIEQKIQKKQPQKAVALPATTVIYLSKERECGTSEQDFLDLEPVLPVFDTPDTFDIHMTNVENVNGN